MIDKITKNNDNLGEPDLYPIKDIKEKLDYYRNLFGKIQDLSDTEFQELKSDISNVKLYKGMRVLSGGGSTVGLPTSADIIEHYSTYNKQNGRCGNRPCVHVV